MGLRLGLLNLSLRLFIKTALGRMRDPAEMRRSFERNARRFFSPPIGANFAAARIRRPDGGAIEALWCSRSRPDRRKVVLYLHGGAYLAGSVTTHRHLGAALAGAAGARLLMPEYRLAPEHPFPAALEDAAAAYGHLLDAGYDAERIALAGDSAGGGLVFALLLRLAAEGRPLPCCAVGFSPWADMTGRAPSLNGNERRDVMLPAGRLPEVVRFYLRDHDAEDPLASPVFGNWRDPPPALIMASRSEILLDDAIGLAEALRRGGGDVRLELWRGLPHAWPLFAGLLPEADLAVAQAGAFIARHLRVSGT
ncbi:MAG TPA: alpha/beta hydrolase fold domain-containing protein [Paracoccaceae bacterium]|nr:alpha/beta hydrolase fold domain-containing protein [Paracoccaceae bacterium]